VLFVVLCGGYLGGLTGAFLAVPTTAVMRVLCSYLYAKIVPPEDRMLLAGAAAMEPSPPEPVPSPVVGEPPLLPD
jgi:hypothetical protein